MKRITMLIYALFLLNCKKPDQRTGIQLSISGPKSFQIEVIKGKPLTEISDIDQWRPDVVFWATVPNKFIELKPGYYTIVLKNIATDKLITVPAEVWPAKVTAVKGNL